jgi:hypothetical protein
MTRVLAREDFRLQVYAPSLRTAVNWPRLAANAITLAGFLGAVAMLLNVRGV